MKCPVCGDEVRNGRCSFCGYRMTEADQQAREKYERQKADLERGGASDPKRPARKPERSAKTELAPDKKPAAKLQRAGNSREGPAKPAGAERPRLDTARPRPERAGKHDAGKRPGRLKRLLFKLVVLGWIVLYLGLIIQKLVQDPGDTGPPDDASPAWSEQVSGPDETDHSMEGGT